MKKNKVSTIELFTNPRLNVVTEADVPEMQERTTSKHRGVSWSKKYEKWVAQLRHEKKNHFVGNFSDETEAAKAVNRKCRELIGPDVVQWHNSALFVAYQEDVRFVWYI